MGVFTVGRQVALEIDMPGWWLANASVDMDFRRGLYYDSSTANPRAATDFLSCTRASTGYAKTNAGTLTSFASNALRITDLGLLVEDARTNVCTNSQDFASANWNTSSITKTNNVTTAPDGTTTAASLIPTNASASHNATNTNSAVTFSAGSATASCYLKAAGYNFAYVVIDRGSGVQQFGRVIDLTNGSIGATFSQGSPTGTSAAVETLTNGWYRLSVTMDVTAGSFVSLQYIGSSNSDGLSAFVGDTVSGCYAWGAQVEQGAFASSYIPTTGAAATRAADAVKCAGNADTILSALPHTSLVDIIATVAPTSTMTILGDDSHEPVDFLTNSENNRVGSFMAATSLSAFFPTALFTTGVKIGTAVATSARSITGNGAAVNTDTSAAAGTSGSIYLGSGAASFRVWYGYIRRLTIWNSKLADATLQGFTV